MKKVMLFKRVLHPVGQGAFFTEQFFDDQGTAVFNVVYDCGEKSTKKHLHLEIDNTLNLNGKPLVLDVMFVSHLDEDHINGIEHLVNSGCLTKRSVVILPLHYPLVLKLMLQQFRNAGNGFDADGMYDGLLSLFDSEAKILGVDNNEEELTDAERLDEGLANIAPYSAVKSMKLLQYRDLWYYLPFNLNSATIFL